MKFLIVDDHPMVRQGMTAVLRSYAHDVVIEEANGAVEALERCALVNFDAVLLDLNLPDIPGTVVLRKLIRAFPQLQVIVFSSSEAQSDVRESITAGARGYLTKSSDAKTIIDALHFVLAGNIYIPTLMLDQQNVDTAARPLLTERQLEVLELVCIGHPNKEISRRLGMAEKTTKTHISAIFRALNVVNRTQASSVAKASGLITNSSA